MGKILLFLKVSFILFKAGLSPIVIFTFTRETLVIGNTAHGFYVIHGNLIKSERLRFTSCP